jgi:hypothetical protein
MLVAYKEAKVKEELTGIMQTQFTCLSVPTVGKLYRRHEPTKIEGRRIHKWNL